MTGRKQNPKRKWVKGNVACLLTWDASVTQARSRWIKGETVCSEIMECSKQKLKAIIITGGEGKGLWGNFRHGPPSDHCTIEKCHDFSDLRTARGTRYYCFKEWKLPPRWQKCLSTGALWKVTALLRCGCNDLKTRHWRERQCVLRLCLASLRWVSGGPQHACQYPPWPR